MGRQVGVEVGCAHPASSDCLRFTDTKQLVECVGTASMNLLTGQIGATLIGYGTPQIGAYIGLSNLLLLSAFIYATAAPSGGHLNPMITFCTMLSGICPVPRGAWPYPLSR